MQLAGLHPEQDRIVHALSVVRNVISANGLSTTDDKQRNGIRIDDGIGNNSIMQCDLPAKTIGI